MAEMPEDRVFARWYNDRGEVEDTRTFHGIWSGSGEIAHLLRVEWGLSKGDRVLLAFNFGLEFFVAFLGCLRAGVVAVPVYPPNPATLKKSTAKLRLVVESCEPKLIVVDAAVNRLRLASKLRAMAGGGSGWPDVPYRCPVVPEEAGAGAGAGTGAASNPSLLAGWLSAGSGGNGSKARCRSFDEPGIRPEDVAFLQFTSGSTSDPKGVIITFANVDHNTSCIIRCAVKEVPARRGPQGEEERAFFSWLPTFHDMGLIQGTLAPFLAGWRSGYCSPVTFVRNPLLWLRLMTDEKSQMTPAPDFAYRLCARRWSELTPQARADLNLDLRHLELLQNSAEPVRASTVRGFARAFAPVGLRPSAPIATYGLAENTAACSVRISNPEGRDLDSLSDEQLQACGDASYAVSFGHYKIVDPKTFREVPKGETGELWLASTGGSVAAGYWGKPELTQETFRARIKCDAADGAAEETYLRTGDRCHIDADGLLHIEGRIKDLIIINGRNIYPQDIEFVADDASPFVRPGCIAAFSETELGGGLEIVLEVRETAKRSAGGVPGVLQAVRRSVVEECGLCPTRVVAIKERTIPKTTSGKIQRRQTRTLLHGGDLEVVEELSQDPSPPRAASVRGSRRMPKKSAGKRRSIAPAPPSDESTEMEEAFPLQPRLSSSSRPGQRGTGAAAAASALPELGRPSLVSGGSAAENLEAGARAIEPAGGRDGLSGDVQFQEYVVALSTEDIVRIVESSTGLEGLEASDDLLNLGVDSLMSVGIAMELSQASGLEVPDEVVFRYPTADLIAGFLGDLHERWDLEKGRKDSTETAGAAVAVASVRLSESTRTATASGRFESPRMETTSARFEGGRGSGRGPSPSGVGMAAGAAWTTGPMKGWSFRIAQVLLLVLVVAQIFLATQPARYYWRYLDDLGSTSFWGYSKQPWLHFELPVFGRGAKGSTSGTIISPYGLLRVLSPSIWFACYTAIVVLTKWLLVALRANSPRERFVPLSSRSYLAWWYLNVLLNVWEATGGRWLLDTRLLILFYRVLGTKVAWNANIRVFLRDFDSLEIRAGATVGGHLYVRRFEASHMAVLPVVVGEGADIRTGSVVYGGTSVGRNCVIEPLTVIPPSSYLPPNSIWEGHPAKAIKGGSDVDGGAACDCKALPMPRDPCTYDLGAVCLEVIKQASIVATVFAMVSMTHVPVILYASMGLPESFRYALLVRLAFLFVGFILQFAILTVALKWILAGRVRDGAYRPNLFRTWRRWYLGRLQALVDAYFLVFNQGPRYYWWGRALGMDVARGATVFLRGTNPMDADLTKIGSGAHVAFPTFSIDRPGGCSAAGAAAGRERRTIWIGSNSLVGFGSHLGGSVGDGSRLGGYSLLRPGEYLPQGSITMCDLQSAYRTGDPHSAPQLPKTRGAISHTYHGPREAVRVNILDAACTLGLWLLNTLSVVASFEVTKFTASLSPYNDGVGTRYVVLSTVALIAWALSTSLLLPIFKRVFAGGFDRTSPRGARVGAAGRATKRPALDQAEAGLSGAQEKIERRRARRLTTAQCMQWRWMWRALFGSLFEPYVVNVFLKGTWLFNAWLRLMGADVSMGALVLGKVSDHGLVKVCEGAVVDGILYGHRGIYIDGLLTMEMAPVFIGECGVVHAHTASWGVNVREGSTITAVSATLPGTVFEAGEVYGGRPPRKLGASWVA